MDGLLPAGNAASLYYFFSSAAQAVAAIVGLSAALAIFRYQNLLMQINHAAEILVRYFGNADLMPYWPWDLAGGGGGQKRYRDSTTANGHMNILRPFFLRAPETETSLRAVLEKAHQANAKEVASRIGAFLNLKLSFEKYDAIVAQARRLRRLTIFTTAFGLMLMLYSLCLTLSPDIAWLSGNVLAWLVFAAGLATYAALTLCLTVIAFADPLRDR